MKKTKEKDLKITGTKWLIVFAIIVALMFIAVMILHFLKKDTINTFEVSKDLTKLNYIGTEEYSPLDDKVYTSYEELSKYYNVEGVKELDFINNNYAIISVSYDNCGEKNPTPTSYKKKGNNVIVTVYYDKSCGFCAPLYDYYALAVDKSVTSVNIEFDSISRNVKHCDPNVVYKPIIYLYPTEKTNVSVKLGYPNKITTSYPKYNKGWLVTADQYGNLYDFNNKYYYALYWEGKNFNIDVTNEGFVVTKENIIPFLEEKLELLGLNEKERNEFIMYWLPRLEKSNLNYIRFVSKEEIDNYMPLIVEPKPDNVIRVYMAYKPLKKEINAKEQKLVTPSRTGFTVVEWGGSEI
ncbi:MAG: hypothetical protein IKR57_06380 [Bacilli bacterium]|nr:hypothetical protein [Bacilli bacterium]